MPFYNLVLIFQKLIRFRRKREIGFQKGSQWFSITDDFCRYIVKEKAFVLKRFKYTLCPDEIFVLDDSNEGNMRLIDWTRGAPYVWRRQNYEELLQSEQLFARKFSSEYMEVVDLIREKFS